MSDREADKITLNIGDSLCEIHGRQGEYIFELISSSEDFYEASLLRSLHSVFPAHEDGLFVDVGANIGNHTVYFAKAMGADVLAVEPIEDNLNFLRKNVQANNLSDQVEIAAFAAWNTNEELQLDQSVQGNSGTFSIASEGKFVTEGKKLDDVLGDSRVSLIKIDVEGAELQVLEGALETIKKWHPLLIVEAHGAEIVNEHRSLLEPLDYYIVNISGRSDNYIWVSSAEKAARIRDEFRVINHRREQRKLNASLAQQKNLLETLNASVESLTPSSISSCEASDPSHRAKVDLQNRIESNLEDIQDSIRNLPTSDPNVTLQLTQLAVELGRHSAALTENNRRLKKVLPRLKDSATLLESIPDLKASVDERLADVVERLEEDQPHENLFEPIANKLDDVDTSIEKMRDDFGTTQDSLQEVHQAFEERLEKVLVRLDEVAAAQEETSNEVVGTSDDLVSESEDLATVKEQRDRLFAAYRQLSYRFERHHPDLWDSEIAIRALQRHAANGSQTTLDQIPSEYSFLNGADCTVSDGGTLKSLPRREVPYRQRVRVGIASMPGREATLAKVLHRIAPQADEVLVYLNNMKAVPQECSTVPDNVHFFTGPDLGDRGKFRFLEGFNGYYLTVDDDIDYSRYHVISLINAIEKYNRKAIVGWHGSIFQEPFEDFYDPTSRKVLTYGSLRGFDTPVHLLGTGVCGFHTDSISLEFEDFHQPNMADVFLAIQAKKQEVPMLVIAHEKGEAKPLETVGSISDASLGKKEHNKEKLNVREQVTKLVKDTGPWTPTGDPIKPLSPPMKVAVVGRTNPKRWRKGGILKSCLLTRQMLLPYGCKVHLADIIDGDPIGLEGFQPDVVMVYVGDPERPDFKEVHRIVEHHADRGTPVLVNLSEDSNPQRTRAIAQVMERWHTRYAGLVKMMAFTPSVQNVFEYQSFAENIVTIPKTLTFEHETTAEYETSTGIFVGDVAKLSDPRIVGPNVEGYIHKLKEALPEARIYGVRQYKPKYEVPSGIDEVWPHLPQHELAEKIAGIRMMVNFAKYATYEMVPVETAGMGVPVLYRNMPQSLNTALGLAAASFTDPLDLAFTARSLYRNPVLWRQYSRAGRMVTRSQDFDLASAQMYMALSRITALHSTTNRG